MILKGGSRTRTLSQADPKDAHILDNFLYEILVKLNPAGRVNSGHIVKQGVDWIGLDL